jgi:exodeoxyribonuclease VII large subunit
MAVRDRVYLEVPFLQKDEAKAAGARWDPHRRQWWAPPAADLALFGRWIDPEPRQLAGRPTAVRVVQLAEAC